jgi:hypothetical protein
LLAAVVVSVYCIAKKRGRQSVRTFPIVELHRLFGCGSHRSSPECTTCAPGKAPGRLRPRKCMDSPTPRPKRWGPVVGVCSTSKKNLCKTACYFVFTSLHTRALCTSDSVSRTRSSPSWFQLPGPLP